LPLIQVSDLGGVYAVSFLVAAVNGWLFELCFTQAWFRAFFGLPAGQGTRLPSLRLQGAFVVALLGGTLAYGAWRLGQDTMVPGPRIALLQGSVDQRIRNEASKSDSAAKQLRRHYDTLCQMAASAPERPELIVWPETSFPEEWYEFPDGEPLWLAQKSITKVGPDYRTNVLLGLNTEIVSRMGRPLKRYCSALLVRPDGSLGGRYDKMHRVPFGEYIPLREVLPWMDRFAPYDFDYSILPGTRFTRFSVGKYHFGTLICFEDTDPFLAREYVGASGTDGPPVDFLLNISNDGWFDGTSEHDEHLAICRFRAIETRRSVARAVNMGISAVIDSNGRVLEPKKLPSDKGPEVWEVNRADSKASLPLSEWQGFKKVSGVLFAIIPIDNRQSWYATWGDWLGAGCLMITAAGLALSVVRMLRVRRSRTLRVRTTLSEEANGVTT
jgi:apolipoprotein N-acyltransferase